MNRPTEERLDEMLIDAVRNVAPYGTALSDDEILEIAAAVRKHDRTAAVIRQNFEAVQETIRQRFAKHDAIMDEIERRG